jgi:tRNA 2-thiouridine synthesizing protein A
MKDGFYSQDEIDISILLNDLKSMRGDGCAGCSAEICGHEALMSLVMGFKSAPQCLKCLSTVLAHDSEALRDHLFAFIGHRSCYHGGWLWANHEEGFQPDALPGCLWPVHSTDTGGKRPLFPAVRENTRMPDTGSEYDAEWDAGDMGCGDLVLELRIRLQSIKPGEIIKVLASDSGAEEDLPAWCRMTGNQLIASHHPIYLIKRKIL